MTTAPAPDGRRLAAFSGASYDAEARTAQIVITTATPVRRFGMIEILQIDAQAVDLSRVALGQMKLLDSHQSGSIDYVLGDVTEAHIEGDRLVGTIRFAASPEGDEAAQRVSRGEITGISCGYQVRQWQRTAIDPDSDIETWTAVNWELLEVSLVSVPADKFAGVRQAESASGRASLPATQPLTKEIGMPEGTETTTPAAPALTPANPAVDTAAAVRAERERIMAISTLASRHALPEDFVSRHIADGTTIEAVRAAALEHLETTSPARAIPSGGATVVDVVNPGESPADTRAAMLDAIVLRACGSAPDVKRGQPAIDNAARARDFAGLSVLQMGAELLGIRGYHRMDRARLFDEVQKRSTLGTSDFPLLLSLAANKFLLAQYQYQDPSYRRLAARKSFNDFKLHSFLRVGDFPILEKVSETGEIKRGALSENREQVQAATYAKSITMTRQMLVNDDLSAFSDMTAMAGRRVADFENALAWSIILSASAAGPTMSDGGTLFNATAVTTAGGHANQAGTGGAVTVANISAGRLAMRQQKSLDGVPLQLDPRMIIAGPAKQTEIEQLLSTQLLATQVSSINPFNGGGLTRLDPVIDSYITDNSWYLMADPVNAPTFIYGYVTGYDGPRFGIDQPFHYDGLSFKVIEDFGFGVIDWRAVWRNPGA